MILKNAFGPPLNPLLIYSGGGFPPAPLCLTVNATSYTIITAHKE